MSVGEFLHWEFFDKFDQFQEIVDNYLFPNISISHPINLYQKLIFMQTKILNQKSVLDAHQKSVLYAPLFARQLLDNNVSQFNVLEGLT